MRPQNRSTEQFPSTAAAQQQAFDLVEPNLR
jgi:hypothetical protein